MTSALFFFKQKTAYEILARVELLLELFRRDARDAQTVHEAPALDVLPGEVTCEHPCQKDDQPRTHANRVSCNALELGAEQVPGACKCARPDEGARQVPEQKARWTHAKHARQRRR